MPIPELLTGLAAWSIPSPSDGVWNLGPIPLRGYALCIIAGIIAAIIIGERRWVARGGRSGDVQDLALLAIPFGLVGARLYHVATDWQQYFGAGGDPVAALYVWRGGLGIWGGIAFGALGIYLGARAKGVRFSAVLDTLAPGVLVGQAIGRWGNWFNQELYGSPTDLPWGLEIDPANWPTDCDYPPGSGTCTFEVGTTFHPTFLYECLWALGAFAVLLWLEKRFRLGYGRVMAVYVMLYTAGRAWIEYMRIDDVQLDDVLGLRWNVWMSIVLFVLAGLYVWWSSRRHPGREPDVYLPGRGPETDAADESDEADEADESDEPDEADDADEAEVEEAAQRPSRDRGDDVADTTDQSDGAAEADESGTRRVSTDE